MTALGRPRSAADPSDPQVGAARQGAAGWCTEVSGDRAGPRAAAWLRAARPRQWVKNVLVAAAPAAALRFGVVADLQVVLALAVMSLAASGGYLLNDALDRAADRAHPSKRLRPVAAGLIGARRAGLVGAAAMAAATVAAAALLGVASGLIVGGYCALTAVYSLALKRVAYLDVAVIAAGFALRVLLGGAASGTPISAWFMAATVAGALTVAAGKRRSEDVLLRGDAAEHRASLVHYGAPVTGSLLVGGAACLVVTLTAWAFVAAGAHLDEEWAVLLVAPTVAGTGRYLQLAWRGAAGEPECLIADPVLVAAAFVGIGLYVAGRLAT